MSNPLRDIEALGQSIWLDNISRQLLDEGTLRGLIEEDGISGVTSNPTIFEKAMGHSDRYDDAFREQLGETSDVEEIFNQLAYKDIRDAADLLRPTWDRTNGADGHVSFEVAASLAYDADKTIEAAKHHRAAIDRPNVLIKVPGTDPGVRAFEELTAIGLNVNVTLLFAVSRYEAIAEAYIRGLERRAERGESLESAASVASFFVSRVDTKVDAALKGTGREDLRGKAAVANAKIAYRSFQRLFSGPRWEALAAKGARVQRPLWASTSTKNPDYPDTLYVDNLIGPDTVNTMPDQTIDATRDHGTAKRTVDVDVDRRLRRSRRSRPPASTSRTSSCTSSSTRVSSRSRSPTRTCSTRSKRRLRSWHAWLIVDAAVRRRRRRDPRAGHRSPARGFRAGRRGSSCSSGSESLAQHQTSHNSGVVHAGIYYAPGSLKARLCRRGLQFLRDFCAQSAACHTTLAARSLWPSTNVRSSRCAASRSAPLQTACPGSGGLEASELAEVEPYVTGVAGLHSPETAIADFAAVARAYASDVTAAGGEIRTGVAVARVLQNGRQTAGRAGRWHRDRRRQGDRVRGASGGSAGDGLRRAGRAANRPVPGEYWRLRAERTHLVRGLIYPVPDPALPFLGVHLTRKIDGTVVLGPNAILSTARHAYERRQFVLRDTYDALSLARHVSDAPQALAGRASARSSAPLPSDNSSARSRGTFPRSIPRTCSPPRLGSAPRRSTATVR